MRAVTFAVVLYTNDERDDADDRLALNLASDLFMRHGPQTDKQGRHWELRSGMKSYTYDPLAHDGHHEGHTQPLTIVKKESNSRGAV